MHLAVRLAAVATGARHTDGEELMAFQALAALLRETRRVPAGEGLRVVETLFALVGLGEDQGDGPRLPTGFLLGNDQLGEIANELHRVEVFVALTRFNAR